MFWLQGPNGCIRELLITFSSFEVFELLIETNTINLRRPSKISNMWHQYMGPDVVIQIVLSLFMFY